MGRAAAAFDKAPHLCIVAVLVGRLAVRDFVIPAAQRIHVNLIAARQKSAQVQGRT